MPADLTIAIWANVPALILLIIWGQYGLWIEALKNQRDQNYAKWGRSLSIAWAVFGIYWIAHEVLKLLGVSLGDSLSILQTDGVPLYGYVRLNSVDSILYMLIMAAHYLYWVVTIITKTSYIFWVIPAAAVILNVLSVKAIWLEMKSCDYSRAYWKHGVDYSRLVISRISFLEGVFIYGHLIMLIGIILFREYAPYFLSVYVITLPPLLAWVFHRISKVFAPRPQD